MQQLSVGALKSPSTEDLTRLSTLSVVSSHLCSAANMETLLPVVLESLVTAFGADRGFIHIYNLDRELLDDSYLDVTADERTAPFTFTQTSVTNCLDSRKPVLVIDTDEVAPTQSVMMTGIRSVMLSPLITEERLIGVVYLDSLIKAGCFEENDLRLFTLIADMVSIACDRNLHVVTVKRQAEALDDAQAQLDIAAEETIRRLSRAAEFRDGETSEHLTRVSEYCEAVSRYLGLEENQVRDIKIASLLHDVGKLGIPDSIMLKPGRFTDYERKVMQQHTLFGAKILANSTNPVIELAALVALRHHEKWDGSGYPDGISGEEIPLAARIVAAADVFDAVSSARRYKESYSLEDSFELLRKEAGSHFDPKVIDSFLAIKDQIETIWNENQDQTEGEGEESKPETPEKVENKVERPLTPESALELVESSPTTLAKESKFEEDIKKRLHSAVECLHGNMNADGQAELKSILELVNKEGVSFHDATKLAQLVQGLRTHLTLESEIDNSAKLLIVDSDPYQREVISTEATRRGMRVFECGDTQSAANIIEQESPDLLLLELDDSGGEELLNWVVEKYDDLPIMIFESQWRPGPTLVGGSPRPLRLFA